MISPTMLARLPALQRRLLDATVGRALVLVAGQVLHEKVRRLKLSFRGTYQIFDC